MARAKKKEKTEAELLWDDYFAMQLTPEQKAAARAELEKDAEEAARAGVYDDLLALKGKLHFTMSWEELRRMDDEAE